MYFGIKELSRYLKIKPSTLYAWAAQGKIPRVKIHGLIRFRQDEIDRWVESFRDKRPAAPPITPKGQGQRDINALIARAKQEVYNTSHGETRPISSLRKEGADGSI